jgi:MoxR-like ATPase
MVLATQNPLEYEGTHALPESQLDRFLLRIRIGYPAQADEKALLRDGGSSVVDRVTPVLGAADVLELQERADAVRADESVLDYVMALVEATRRAPALALGVSPRGALALLRAARAHALVDGREFLVPDDVKTLAVPALAHRVLLRSRSGGSGQGSGDAEAVIRSLLADVAVPR